ncbi:EF-P lysine aminoacylase EpmA [Thiolapillus sp.]
MKPLQEKLLARARLLARIRRFFEQRNVMEVCTPVLSQAAGPDPALEPLRTRYTGPGYPAGRELFMQTSPEFAMKRLLAAGCGPIYQVAQVFRNGELGLRHNPEFTLLEWYRPGFDHHDLMTEVSDLVSSCLGQGLVMEKISYVDLFQQKFAWNPLQVDTGQLEETARTWGIHADNISHRDQWLDLLMSLVLEPELGREGLTFVYDYPASQASLARLNVEDKRIASRFELYCQGVELANGFHELTNAAEQRQRFEDQNHQRQQQGLPQLPIDENFLQALEQGLPDCAGVAVGLDRLLMLQQGETRLDAVLTFSLLEA